MKHVPNGREERSKSIANSRQRRAVPTAGEQAAIGAEEFTKQPSVTKQRERRLGADVSDVTTAQGPEHDGAYLEPVTCLR